VKIPALSLWEPLATAMARGLKKIDTRTRRFSYRGPLAIHAAKRRFDETDRTHAFRNAIGLTAPGKWEYFIKELQARGLTEGLAYGKMVCIVNVVDCVSCAEVKRSLMPYEYLLGNYTGNRQAILTGNLYKIEEPIEIVGHQGLFHWELPQHLESVVNEMVKNALVLA
jgi:activating signal cointegrator 1